jgi:hypothetical protein
MDSDADREITWDERRGQIQQEIDVIFANIYP